MASRTQLFQLLPWIGGLNTSVDESMIPSNQLTVADNVIFDTRGSRKKREGIEFDWSSAFGDGGSVIKLHDFWFGATTRDQKLVGVSSAGGVYDVDNPDPTLVTDGGTAWTVPLTNASTLTFNNKCLIAVSGTGNVMKMWDGSGNVADVPGTPPEASILCEHLGRIWCNSKANPDRIYYSPVGDHTVWNGTGDSGGFDIGAGDGDPDGITAIASFRGDLFVFKRTKTYRVVGQFPEDTQVIKLSDSTGCIAHNSVVAVEQDDLIWVSERGVHSMAATQNYGDFTSSYMSADVQRTFNDDFTRARLKYTQGAYLPQANSLAFAFTEESGANKTLTTGAVTNTLMLYNIPLKAWYRWPDLPCTSLVVSNDPDAKRFYFGSHTGRVAKSFTGAKFDTSPSGADMAIRYKVATGTIFVDNSPYLSKALKRFILFYKPAGKHNITVNIKVDNVSLSSENSLLFSGKGANPLGTPPDVTVGFHLGSTPLGSSAVFTSAVRHIEGIGRGVKITFEQTGIEEDVEIQGFGIEWEPAGFVFESNS